MEIVARCDHTLKLIEGFSRIGFAGAAPAGELDRVDAAIAVFYLMDGAGGQSDRFGEAALRVARLLADFE